MNRVFALALAASAIAIGAFLADPPVNLQAVTPGVQQAGHINVSGRVIAGSVIATDSSAGAQVVVGNATGTSGANYGGLFRTSSSAGTGVRGVATSASGGANGGTFQTSSPNGAGVRGFATSMTGTNYGVYGQAVGVDAFAGFFQGRLGVLATVAAPNAAFRATNTGSGFAGEFVGQLNVAASGQGAEILRFSTERPWVFRQTYTGPSAGLELFSTVGAKVFQITASGGTPVASFVAEDANPRVGIGTPTPTARLDVVAATGKTISGKVTSDQAEDPIGVSGEVVAATGRGVYGSAKYLGVGVYGENEGAFGWGVYSKGRSGSSGTKSFRIDHPLDPENKYLLHYSAEGPEPVNHYRGTVVTDDRGFAWIQLPDYFEEINLDPTFQLTVVDSSDEFIQAKVTQKVRENRFQIRTSRPNVEVCWRVEARRNDLWVRKHGAPQEEAKRGAERGSYQHPELYGRKRDRPPKN